MKKEKLQKQLIDILLKKANGFYYYEEQEDYEKTQNKTKLSTKSATNISFFDNFVTQEPNISNNNDTLKLSNGKEENKEELTLVKKKITKHYIPPDMLAIKILFEINKEKVSDDVENLSDEELLKLKDKLIGEILNDN